MCEVNGILNFSRPLVASVSTVLEITINNLCKDLEWQMDKSTSDLKKNAAFSF
jgi:hypothetical protein